MRFCVWRMLTGRFGTLFVLTFSGYFFMKGVNRRKKVEYIREQANAPDVKDAAAGLSTAPAQSRTRPMSPFESLMYNLERNWNKKVGA